MKILKIFGIVVGIHLFALILIFANPGCTSTTKPAPAPSDTVARNDPAPSISVPTSPTVSVPTDASPVAPATINFNPDAPATAAPMGGSPGVRFTPTRPNTPAASTLVAEPVTDVTPATSYTVKSGDNLWTLAKKNHLNVGELAAANGLKSSAVLHEGQKLIIPGKSTSSTAAAAPAATPAAKAAEAAPVRQPADATKYVVKQGETLGSIARKFDIKQSEIAVANNITDPRKIRAGMELVIPGYKNPTAKSGATTKAGASNGKSTPATAAKVPEIPTIGPSETTAPKPSANDVPVIKVDDSPISPAPAPKG